MKRVALIGNPLSRTHSPTMHNAAFQEHGIDAVYEIRELEPDEVPGFVAEARGSDWLGFQITAPYKQLVIDHLDSVEGAATQIGAVNSVAHEEGQLIGFNTDAPGFRRAAEDELEIDFDGISAVVAGAGGAARAVVQSLVSAGARSVVVGNRTASRAVALAHEFGDRVRGLDLGWDFESALGAADLAINATTMGMIDSGSPFDVVRLPDTAAVYDLVYSPPESPLLREARERGLRAANGLGMLVAQAEIAFERWTGVSGCGPLMLSAVRKTSAVDPNSGAD